MAGPKKGVPSSANKVSEGWIFTLKVPLCLGNRDYGGKNHTDREKKTRERLNAAVELAAMESSDDRGGRCKEKKESERCGGTFLSVGGGGRLVAFYPFQKRGCDRRKCDPAGGVV